MEVDQFMKKAGMKAQKLRRRNKDGLSYEAVDLDEGQQETSDVGEDNTLLKKLRNYFRFLLSVF